MSLVRRRLEPVLEDLLEVGSQIDPSSARLPIVLIHTINIRGHTYGNSTITAAGAIASHQGDYTDMSNTTRLRNLSHHTPPPSEAGKTTDDGALTSPSTETPPEYRARRHDWFCPGRMLQIWAPSDQEIHQKQFVLLDTKNKEGPGLLMRQHEEGEKDAPQGYFFRNHVNVRDWVPSAERENSLRRKIVYLDEYEDMKIVDELWIELEHTYNIPFATYPCIDGGVLAPRSLIDLRQFYVNWLQHLWNLD